MSAKGGRLYLDQTLAPRRSLSKRGVAVLMGVLIAFNLLFGTVTLLLGGVFVPPFLFLDVAGMGIALWVSFRSAGRFERVRVSADEVTVTREGRGRVARPLWRSATAFTRLEHHPTALRLRSKDRGLLLAASLGPKEREAFGRALDDAIRAARAERWPT